MGFMRDFAEKIGLIGSEAVNADLARTDNELDGIPEVKPLTAEQRGELQAQVEAQAEALKDEGRWLTAVQLKRAEYLASLEQEEKSGVHEKPSFVKRLTEERDARDVTKEGLDDRRFR